MTASVAVVLILYQLIPSHLCLIHIKWQLVSQLWQLVLAGTMVTQLCSTLHQQQHTSSSQHIALNSHSRCVELLVWGFLAR
jgi:hypothetical protein